MRIQISKLSLSLAGLLVCGWTSLAFAVEEIAEPAGEVPEPEALPEVAPTEDSASAEAPAPKTAKVKGKAALKKGKAEERAPENWDSYSEAGTGGVAQEITRGVRVEDIVEPPSDYRYAAFGKADPFVPPTVTSDKPLGPGNLEIPIISPLQRHNVSEMELVGVWQLASGERKAMVMTPSGGDSGSGQGIIVKNGDPIGTKGGKILGIGDDFPTVREFLLAADGTRQYEDQQMDMGKRNPEDKPGKIVFKPGDAQPQVLLDSALPGTQLAPQNRGAEPAGTTNGVTKDGTGSGTAKEVAPPKAVFNTDAVDFKKKATGAEPAKASTVYTPAPAPKTDTTTPAPQATPQPTTQDSAFPPAKTF